jgi:glycosyltransferase involved in cell wall biosynthesis
MKEKKLKVFHGLVNYGTQAGLFAAELRNNGIQALSVTVADSFKRKIDKELFYGGNGFQKILKHGYNWLFKFYCFFRYNTFHFYFGITLFKNQRDLPLYKFFGKKVVMEYLGWDLQLYQMSVKKYKHTNARYYKDVNEALRGDIIKLKRLKLETKYVNKQLVCAPYLSEFLPNADVFPLAIDIEEIKFLPNSIPDKSLKILHAPTHQGNKGTMFIQNAINKLTEEGFSIEFKLVSGITHSELLDEYIQCDIFIDQVAGGWYGTASIEAMATGRPTICFIRESYFDYIDYGDEIPLINANPDTIYEVLKRTINEKEKLPEIGRNSRKFVEEVHNVKALTLKLIKIYNNL